MSKRNVTVILVLILAGTWWFLHEDPEAEVRDAHQELTRLLSKSEGDTTGTMLVDARRLQGLFAESCEVTGDAEMLVGTYTRENMVSTIIQVQALFTSIDLTFHELVVDFPTSDDALVNFTAVLVGRSTATGGEEAAETREVVTRLRKVEGAWLFSEFRLAKVLEN